MKIRNVLLLIVALVLLVGGGAAYYLFISLDSIVKSAIEENASEVTGTRVRVGSVRISLQTGEGTIQGLRVANPEGFPSGDAFELGEISLGLDLATLTESPIVVSKVLIAAPVVAAVFDEQGRSNLDVIRRNAERYSAKSPKQETPEAAGAETLIRIDDFRFQDGRVAADLTELDSKKVETALPGLELRAVGGQGGSPPAEVGKTIIVAFSKAVAAALTRSGAERLIDEKLGGEAGEAAKSLLRRIIR